jgi:cytochrome c oxidase cbb3-type subunit 3
MAADRSKAWQIPGPIDGIPFSEFSILLGILLLELIIVFFMAISIGTLLNIIKRSDLTEAPVAVAKKQSWFWDKFNKAASIEKERDILMDHNYDGIQELDNSLPPWWKYGFMLTILVGIIYMYRYHVAHTGRSQEEEYVAEMQQGEEDKAAYLAHSANNVDETNVKLLTDALAVGAGREVFQKNCVACHLADGGGSVGPNLTDDYWIHGGGIVDIFKTVKYGWQEKGMKSWKDDLSPNQMQQVASYIKSLKGTHPASPKAPQGDLYVEVVKVDSAVSVK